MQQVILLIQELVKNTHRDEVFVHISEFSHVPWCHIVLVTSQL